eukprot:GFKZ01006989.1.p1 GENE.GFKZ01006989.1~~GFKZ01006989.1.p1  ORF type:complete len:104 (+),score=6.49 GFKZ01006989.1:137-448(+)
MNEQLPVFKLMGFLFRSMTGSRLKYDEAKGFGVKVIKACPDTHSKVFSQRYPKSISAKGANVARGSEKKKGSETGEEIHFGPGTAQCDVQIECVMRIALCGMG